MKTLLSHLYSKIEGSPEDLATESLIYILNNSIEAKDTFTNYIYSLVNLPKAKDKIYYKTQQSGIDLTRPDIVGINRRQEESIIIESKFWAGLTENQPIGYLKRLAESNYEGKKILLFISPEKRIITLWSELKRKCNDEYNFSENAEDYYLNLNESLVITLISWKKIINAIRQELIVNNLDILLSDLNQLDGLCSRMDEEAFLPLREADLGINIPKRVYGYIQLIDKLTERLKIEVNANTKGLRSSNFYDGYKQYIMINNRGVSLEFNLKYWIKRAETPLWIGIKDNNWNYDSAIRTKLIGLKNIDLNQIFIGKHGYTYVPLFLPLRVSEDIIIKELVDFIDEIFKVVS
jgi:hypothetical protein